MKKRDKKKQGQLQKTTAKRALYEKERRQKTKLKKLRTVREQPSTAP